VGRAVTVPKKLWGIEYTAVVEKLHKKRLHQPASCDLIFDSDNSVAEVKCADVQRWLGIECQAEFV
jgi:hypothetical protein